MTRIRPCSPRKTQPSPADNGAEVTEQDLQREPMKVDVSALLGGDVHAALRKRGEGARKRFAKECDDQRALKERCQCMGKLQEELLIPPEALLGLPSPDEIRAKAQQAAEAAREAEARQRRQDDAEPPDDSS